MTLDRLHDYQIPSKSQYDKPITRPTHPPTNTSSKSNLTAQSSFLVALLLLGAMLHALLHGLGHAGQPASLRALAVVHLQRQEGPVAVLLEGFKALVHHAHHLTPLPLNAGPHWPRQVSQAAVLDDLGPRTHEKAGKKCSW